MAKNGDGGDVDSVGKLVRYLVEVNLLNPALADHPVVSGICVEITSSGIVLDPSDGYRYFHPWTNIRHLRYPRGGAVFNYAPKEPESPVTPGVPRDREIVAVCDAYILGAPTRIASSTGLKLSVALSK